MTTYAIDGERFSTLEEFYDDLDRVLNLAPWGRNLNAFKDILRGGFGTPEEGFVIRGKNHAVKDTKSEQSALSLFPGSVCFQFAI
jgi:RNAse (barnase) inhibitor barstar